MSNDPLKLSVRGLKKSFGSKHVLQGVDLDLAPGKSLVVIGGSGTGKSVLLKCVLGLISPDEGEIKIDGRPTTRIAFGDPQKATRQIGMLFQGAALFDSLKVWENVAFRLVYGEGASPADARERALECLSQVGLGPDIAELAPAELSGGMQKRVGLARAIAANPSVLFFDEPTTGLDPIMADVINNLILQQVNDLGRAAVSITHDMASAVKIADEIAMLHEGRIIWRGVPDDIYASGEPCVDQFVHGRAEGPITAGLSAAR